MKQTFLLLIALCISVLAIHGCKKVKDPEPDNPWGLPNATQEGANTFACRINGENWIAEDRLHSPLNISFKDSSLYISGRDQGGFVVQIKNDTKIQSNQRFFLGDTLKSFAGYYGSWKKCNQDFIQPKKSFTGELLITTIDTAKRFVSGTFHFKIIIPDCDTLDVTDGRFDLRYN